MQESYENFLHEKLAKDRDTLIQHSIFQITNISHKILSKHKANNCMTDLSHQLLHAGLWIIEIFKSTIGILKYNWLP